ncbi:hypothetical protein DFJ74DRAFT_655895 [Hyaloraphidium curvatum]|nr:hypothetical protein DFJ74DRAFT_655895 [Hyaloraphidium curvatum]
MAACINNQYETLRILLEHPKRITPDQVNKKDRGGTTALMHACRLNLLEIVQELLSPEHPVDLNATDNEGRTAFWHACASGSEAVVRLMLNHQDRVEVNKPDARGVPPRDACSGVLRAVLLEEVVAQGFNRLKVDATRIVYNWRDDSTFLGEGGFGYVYRGHLVGPDGVSRTPAAVKVMIEHQSPELERLFLREVRIWAALEHKNIHRLLAFSLDPCLMASEIADGGDLVAYLFKQTCRRNLTLSKKGIPRLRPAPPPRRLPRPAPRPPQRHHPRRPHPQQRPHLFAPRKDHGLWHGPLPLPPRVLLEKQLRQGDRHVSAARGLRDGECGSAVPQGAERGRVRMGGDAVPGDRGGQAAVPRGGDGGSGQEQRGGNPAGCRACGGGSPPALLCAQIFDTLSAGERPARQEGTPDALWGLIEACWDSDPAKRPSSEELPERLRAIVEAEGLQRPEG